MAMTARLKLLLCVLSAASGVLIWKTGILSSGPGKIELQADAAARRFIRMRDAEAGLDKTVWSSAASALRVESALAVRTETGLASGKIDEFVPGLGTAIQIPQDWKLVWLRPVLLSGARSAGEGGRQIVSTGIEVESVFMRRGKGDRTGGADPEIKTASFTVFATWSDEVELRLIDFRTGPIRMLESESPAFRIWADLAVPTNGVGVFTDPLLMFRDERGPGLLLVGAGKSAVRNGEDWILTDHDSGPAKRACAAISSDLEGNGSQDLVIADGEGLRVRRNSTWSYLWTAPAKLRHPQSLSAGDVDGDGDLDLWLTQYKAPYAGGQFPTPYYDANDGFPSYLLRNDGGRFTDITEQAGLASKRFRRTYSGSFIDLDDDGDVDLVNVSDFAGMDVYLNDGKGRFIDVTQHLGDTRHLFGMAHGVGDFNGDALPDLLALGMDSPVANQLGAMGLGRSDFPMHTAKRTPMTFGNRVFLGGRAGAGGYALRQAPWADELRNGGWAWGVALFDWNNDGRGDVYIANGHETFESRVDFERQFWLHDIYVGGSTNDPAVQLYFMQANERRRVARQSYGGWQANRMFTGKEAEKYEENAWLLGIAVTEDCRNVVAADFDDDGRMDLAVTTYEQWPQVRQRLLIFRNETSSQGRWIGYRFGGSTAGCRVELETANGIRRHWFVTGDSYRSQDDSEAHFGLGETTAVSKAELVLPDKRRITLPTDANRWHSVLKFR